MLSNDFPDSFPFFRPPLYLRISLVGTSTTQGLRLNYGLSHPKAFYIFIYMNLPTGHLQL